MKAFTVDLKTEYAFLQGGKLDCALMDNPWTPLAGQNWKRPAVVVIPGGGYAHVSPREGEPVATYFLAKGFQVFVLTYLVKSDGVRYPEQLLEAAAAVDYVRKNAEEFRVNPEEVFVIGFSAGGHLAANLAVEHQNIEKKTGVALQCKPTAVGLGYPVISKNHGHQGSYESILNGYSEEEKTELLKTLNLNEAVSDETPPAFIWATAKDTVVPPDNALRYAMALDQRGIDYELHIYPRCNHGKSTGSLEVNDWDNGIERLPRWLDDCASFFRLYVEEKF